MKISSTPAEPSNASARASGGPACSGATHRAGGRTAVARAAAPGDGIVRGGGRHRASHPLHGLAYGSEMEAAAKEYDLDPKLLAAVAAQESGRGGIQAHDVDQPHGFGRGPFQIDVRAWPQQAAIAHDPAKSAAFAASLLRDGFRQADRANDARTPGERTREALRVYNGASPHAKTTMTAWPDGKIPYEESVLRRYRQIEAYLAAEARRP